MDTNRCTKNRCTGIQLTRNGKRRYNRRIDLETKTHRRKWMPCIPTGLKEILRSHHHLFLFASPKWPLLHPTMTSTVRESSSSPSLDVLTLEKREVARS